MLIIGLPGYIIISAGRMQGFGGYRSGNGNQYSSENGDCQSQQHPNGCPQALQRVF
jgi:hypothetical protein